MILSLYEDWKSNYPPQLSSHRNLSSFSLITSTFSSITTITTMFTITDYVILFCLLIIGGLVNALLVLIRTNARLVQQFDELTPPDRSSSETTTSTSPPDWEDHHGGWGSECPPSGSHSGWTPVQESAPLPIPGRYSPLPDEQYTVEHHDPYWNQVTDEDEEQEVERRLDPVEVKREEEDDAEARRILRLHMKKDAVTNFLFDDRELTRLAEILADAVERDTGEVPAVGDLSRYVWAVAEIAQSMASTTEETFPQDLGTLVLLQWKQRVWGRDAPVKEE